MENQVIFHLLLIGKSIPQMNFINIIRGMPYSVKIQLMENKIFIFHQKTVNTEFKVMHPLILRHLLF